MTSNNELPPFFNDLRHATHMDEETLIQQFLDNFPLDKSSRDSIKRTATDIVSKSRSLKHERGTMDAFMQEFGLSNQEGVALMCLAEALLRIPDSETQDSLIAEKILSGNWKSHKGNSEDTFVNASVYALMMTGGVIKMDKTITANPVNWFKGLTRKLGEPVIREATNQAMKIMGKQFVFGRTMNEALKRKARQPEHKQVYSFDMLGEAARTMKDAKRFFALYEESIHAVGKDAKNSKEDHCKRSSVSVKLSALHPRFEEANADRVMDELLPDVKELALKAKSYGIGFTIDAEEAALLDISLRMLDKLAHDKDLAGWDGLGLALQAYQKRGFKVIDLLVEMSKTSGRRFPVRLVKGAYWDTEIKHAQEFGHDDYPVFTRKSHSDLSYIVCAHKLLQHPDAFYPQFATHNAHSLAAVAHMAKGKDFEFQRLHGMGDLLYRAAEETLEDMAHVRTYAPVGAHRDLLPYLVRRLLENGANSSFVNRFMDEKVPVKDIVADPYEEVKGYDVKRHTAIPLPKDIYGDRLNSWGPDLDNPLDQEIFMTKVRSYSDTVYEESTLVGGKAKGEYKTEIVSPQNNNLVVGTITEATEDDIELAFKLSEKAQPIWDQLGGNARADILDRLADLIEEECPRFIDLLTREAGKTILDGIAEVREAADFCRYYAMEARKHFGKPLQLSSPTGESNELSLHGRGTFICISPWNFPLAIFVGQVVAALVTGNAVIAKPAEQTPLVATEATKLMYKAGIPHNVMHLLAGDGLNVGAPLIEDQRVAGVCFTGSTAVAKMINQSLAAKDGPIVPLIAETGGQNAMIVDSSALPEQVADDVVQSAFGSAGQRCSALRVLYIQESVADQMIEMIKGALAEQKVGNPALLETDIGPIIDQEALSGLEMHVNNMRVNHEIIAEAKMGPETTNGTYMTPTIIEIPSLAALKDENFGPVLHIVRFRWRDVDQVMRDILDTKFGLTFGIHSRIESRWSDLFRRHRVGNTYINRNMVGAVVGVQPFGGQGLSGTGPKAGGPHYLFRFATERTKTINTTAIGGNTDLFQLDEE